MNETSWREWFAEHSTWAECYSYRDGPKAGLACRPLEREGYGVPLWVLRGTPAEIFGEVVNLPVRVSSLAPDGAHVFLDRTSAGFSLAISGVRVTPEDCTLDEAKARLDEILCSGVFPGAWMKRLLHMSDEEAARVCGRPVVKQC